MAIPRPGARTVVTIAAVALICAAGLLLVRSLDDRSGPSEHIAVPEMRTAPLGTPTPSRPSWLSGIVAVTVDQPDGRAIAIMGLDEAGGSGVLARGFDDVGHLAWSPDGERLAFAARRGGNWDLYLVPRAGGEPARLTDHPAFDGWPAWSPDGSRLAFESAREGRLAVFEMAAPAGPGAEAGAIPGAGTAPDSLEVAAGAASVASDAPAASGASDAPAASGVSDAPAASGASDAPAASGVSDAPAVAGATEPEVTRRSPADAVGPAIEPTWSPDGTRIVYSIWDGDAAVYRLDAVEIESGAVETVLEPADAVDRRAGRFAPDGALVYRAEKYGEGPVRAVAPAAPEPSTAPAAPVAPNAPNASLAPAVPVAPASGRETTYAGEADGYALSPGGDAIVFVSPGRRSSSLEIRGLVEPGRWTLAELDPEAGAVAWTAGELPAGLPAVERHAAGEPWPVGRGGGVASSSLGAAQAAEARPGLVRLDDIDVSGPRINAAVRADFDALRAEIRSAIGHDFLGTLSDMWRPIGFDSSRSAFYSWHKTGRAFDTFMSFTTPGGGDGMVLVREGGGRPVWRMYLWAAAQDGSVGEPLREPGWHFSTAGWDEEEELREGGSRALRVPDGYWVDFTAAAARYGWHRIPAISRPGFDWRESFSAIEFWHYERRDGLSWHDAIAEIYAPEEIEEALREAPPRWGR